MKDITTSNLAKPRITRPSDQLHEFQRLLAKTPAVLPAKPAKSVFAPQHQKIMQKDIDRVQQFYKKKLNLQIRQQQQKTKEVQMAIEPMPKPEQGLRVDQTGRVRDSEGNLVMVKDQSTSLAINQLQKLQKNQQLNQKNQKVKAIKYFNRSLSRAFFDSNLMSTSPAGRRKIYALTFQGENLARKKISKRLVQAEKVPQAEWWDKQYLVGQSYFGIQIETASKQQLQQLLKSEFDGERLKKELLTGDIQEVMAPLQTEKQFVFSAMPTTLQRKKIKRMRRKKKQKEKGDKIKLGLIQPPKPKLKLANMVTVFKDQFLLDPSKIESEVRRQIQQRKDKHEARNQFHKLSKEKRKEKAVKKLKALANRDRRIAVFRIDGLIRPSQAYKINKNAEQLALDGLFIGKGSKSQYSGPALVVVEGGAKAVRFYQNLMSRRIKWQGSCNLVWSGKLKEQQFKEWRDFEAGSEREVRQLFVQKGFQDYFNAILSYRPAQA